MARHCLEQRLDNVNGTQPVLASGKKSSFKAIQFWVFKFVALNFFLGLELSKFFVIAKKNLYKSRPLFFLVSDKKIGKGENENEMT